MSCARSPVLKIGLVALNVEDKVPKPLLVLLNTVGKVSVNAIEKQVIEEIKHIDCD